VDVLVLVVKPSSYPNISFIPDGNFNRGFVATLGKVMNEVKPSGRAVGTG
jgi:hypothetical protein